MAMLHPEPDGNGSGKPHHSLLPLQVTLRPTITVTNNQSLLPSPKQSPRESKSPSDHNYLRASPVAFANNGTHHDKKGGKEKFSPDSRIVLIGDQGVGKSALVVRLLTNRYIYEYDPCLEATYRHHLSVDDENFALEILDTGPQEEGRLNENHVRWADGYMLVFSMTDRRTFESIRKFYDAIFAVRQAPPIPLVIVGNKSDLMHMHQVNQAEASDVANDLGFPLFFTSASEGGEDILEAFREMQREIVRKRCLRRRRSSAKMVVEAMFNRVRTKINN